MLFLHETHEIIGGQTAAFEAAVRDQWRPLIEAKGTARLLWFWHLTHGTGPRYQAVSITAVRDWAAWGAIDRRDAQRGGWREWLGQVLDAAPRGDEQAPAADAVVAAAVGRSRRAAARRRRRRRSILHDTGWPHPGKLDAYVAALGSVFYPQTHNYKMIRVEACWTVCPRHRPASRGRAAAARPRLARLSPTC